MSQPVQIQLTVEESLEFQRVSSYWDGLLEGVRMTADKAKRIKLDELLVARKPPPAPMSTEPPKEGV